MSGEVICEPQDHAVLAASQDKHESPRVLINDPPADEAQLAAIKTQCRILDTALNATLASSSWKLTAPLRRVRQLWRPDTVSAPAFVASAQLLPGTEPGKWESVGTDPCFIACGWLPAGWIRLSVQLQSDVPGHAQLFFETGSGFNPGECINLGEFISELKLDCYLRLDRPARAVRFDPLNQPGKFRLILFKIEAVPLPRLLVRSLKSKLNEVRQRGNPGAALGHALGLLARGDIKGIKRKLMQSLGVGIAGAHSSSYQHWRHMRQITDAARQRMQSEVRAMREPPLISILLPLHNPQEKYLRAALDSVLQQSYPHWELCVAGERGFDAQRSAVLQEFAQRDPRIMTASDTPHPTLSPTGARGNNGIRRAEASLCTGLKHALPLSTGQYVTVLGQHDELAEHALFKVAQTLLVQPELDMLYSDEDVVDAEGEHTHPFFKPDWSPEYFLACMYACRLAVYRTAMVRDAGGFRTEFADVQDYDLGLRLMAVTPRIHHIADVLYHRRMPGDIDTPAINTAPAETAATKRALESYLVKTGQQGRVEAGSAPGCHRVRFAIVGKPKVSIIIPSTCRPAKVHGENTAYVVKCVESIINKSTFKDYEIFVLDRAEMPPEMHEQFTRMGVHRISYSEPFNWSRVNNLGALKSSGSHYLFLNDDIEVLTPDWLECMLEFSQQAAVGAVGAKLLFPNGHLQHAGVFVMQGSPGHPYYNSPGDEHGYFSSNLVHRNFSAVTGACLMTRADVFQSMGGFDEEFGLNYNDVDYCLRLVSSGRRVVYTPYAQCYHHESVTKSGVYAEELAKFKGKWSAWCTRDPFFSQYALEMG